jgi:hypothetical protein
MPSSITSAEYLRSLKSLHALLLAGIILFTILGAISVYMGAVDVSASSSVHKVLMFLVPVASVAGLLMANLLFKKKTDALRSAGSMSLRYRLEQFRSASLLRWALTEAPLMLAIIALILTGSYYYGIFIFLLLIFFILYAPSADKIKMQLELSSEEAALLDDGYAEIK